MPNLNLLETNQQTFELVLPRESSLHDFSGYVDDRVEESFASAFRFLAVARIFGNIWGHAAIKNAFSVFFESNTPSRLR